MLFRFPYIQIIYYVSGLKAERLVAALRAFVIIDGRIVCTHSAVTAGKLYSYTEP